MAISAWYVKRDALLTNRVRRYIHEQYIKVPLERRVSPTSVKIVMISIYTALYAWGCKSTLPI